jgi:hypothetical protein
MLLPPVLEIFVVWHPDDEAGATVSKWLLEHFHGTAFSGLIGGAVEVYTRSAPWDGHDGPPRPLPFAGARPAGLELPTVTVVVPVLSALLARVVEDDDAWAGWMVDLIAGASEREDVHVFALRAPGAKVEGTSLSDLVTAPQRLPDACAIDPDELGREVAQAIVQRISGTEGEALQVFVSHTKRHSPDEEPDHVTRFVDRVRMFLAGTRLVEFFDETSLQTGEDWEDRLVAEASRGCLLMVRTDLYAGRTMCQREVRIAKEAGIPVVELRAVTGYQERGSFLLDHVPSVQANLTVDMADDDLAAADSAIRRAVNMLVDEALKRALWHRQQERLVDAGFDWLPGHAPEPVTALRYLADHPDAFDRGTCIVLHPDPPLLPDERDTMDTLFRFAGLEEPVDIVTPRTFAQRGGRTTQ